jgi:hypothetical protein
MRADLHRIRAPISAAEKPVWINAFLDDLANSMP